MICDIMDEREDALEYLEEKIPDEIMDKIMGSKKFKSGFIHLKTDKKYQNYEDFDGELKVDVFTEDNAKLGEITFYILQKTITVEDITNNDVECFEDYVEDIKVLNYKVF
jgi:hypothetical protein